MAVQTTTWPLCNHSNRKLMINFSSSKLWSAWLKLLVSFFFYVDTSNCKAMISMIKATRFFNRWIWFPYGNWREPAVRSVNCFRKYVYFAITVFWEFSPQKQTPLDTWHCISTSYFTYLFSYFQKHLSPNEFNLTSLPAYLLCLFVVDICNHV